MIITKRSKILGYLHSFSILTDTDNHDFLTGNVIKAYKRNYKETRRDDFVDKFQKQIDTSIRCFRIHLTGHFYSQEYLNSWFEICGKNPLIIFYAYIWHIEEVGLDYSPRPKNLRLINVDQEWVPDAKNIVYTTITTINAFDNVVARCDKFNFTMNCGLCLRCLDTPTLVGSYPWL